MRLVSSINPKLSLAFLVLISSTAFSQENSPFSRVGLGDTYPGQNIVNRGMGGVSVPFIDGQSINFYNPATYSSQKIVTFDVGVTIDSRTLKSANPVEKYSSTNFIPSYFAVAMPLNKKRNLGFAFGLRPISTINYAIEERQRLAGVDSLAKLYQGSGGLYQLFAGIGKRWGNFSLGINSGVNFGRKETNTRVIFISDSLDEDYAQTNSATITTYSNAFLNAGLQYQFKVGKNSYLRLGATANLKQSLKASQDLVRETYQYNTAGAPVRIDSVFQSSGQKGTIEIPATYTAGVLFQNNIKDRIGNILDKSSIAVEYESTQWTKYRFYNQADALANSWQLRVGGSLTPNPLSVTNYWNRVNFRAGFYFGQDRVVVANKNLPVYGATFGAGLPIRKWKSYDNQYTIINTALEIGKRGNKDNNITEGFFRLSFGLALSDIWFVKRRYD